MTSKCGLCGQEFDDDGKAIAHVFECEAPAPDERPSGPPFEVTEGGEARAPRPIVVR